MPLHYNAVSLDSHIVMPNHVHAVVCIDGIHAHSPEGAIEEWRIKLESDSRHLPSLGSIIAGYKSAVARKCHAVGIASFAWQARFYDHIIRGNHAVAAVREYIRNNPQNWDGGLAAIIQIGISFWHDPTGRDGACRACPVSGLRQLYGADESAPADPAIQDPSIQTRQAASYHHHQEDRALSRSKI